MSEVSWAIMQFLVPFLFMLGFVMAIMLPLMIWMERKVAAYIQDRRGPNRANILGIRLFGMIHNIADVLKLILKEDIEPEVADKNIFRIAPAIVMVVALMTMAVVPFSEPLKIGEKLFHFQIAKLNAGILYVFAISSLGVYGLILAGWSSGNRFAFLGGLRASSQMVSYEVALGLSIVGMFLIYGTTDLEKIALLQGANPLTWGVFVSPLGFIIFLACLFAETNRVPFDLPEGESELVAGYHVEYSGLKFALFMMSEYIHIVVGSAIISTLFFGGWQVPFLSSEALVKYSKPILIVLFVATGLIFLWISGLLAYNIVKPRFQWGDMRDNEPRYFFPLTLALAAIFLMLGIAVIPDLDFSKYTWIPTATKIALQISAFCAKTFFFSFFFIWVRWTLPRFRYDQVMRLGWQYFIPLGVANIFITFVWGKFWLEMIWSKAI